MKNSNQINWDDVRKDFPVTENGVYLNAAGMSAQSRVVHKAASDTLDLMSRFPKKFAESVLPNQKLAREAVSRLYNVDVDGVAFTQSTSLGMNLLALTYKNRYPEKRRIVTLDDEFPSSTLPWAVQGFEVDYVKSEENYSYSIQAILEKVDASTAAVVASYVMYNTGARIDVHSLAHELQERGVDFILNATQAAGIIPIDLQSLPVTAFLTSGNKWVMAGVGGSVMYLSQQLRSENFPPFAGWVSSDPISFDNRLTKLRKDASVLELGLISMLPIVSLTSSINYLLDIGIENVHSRIAELNDYLIEKLLHQGEKLFTPVERDTRAGIVAIQMEDAGGVAARLLEQNIVVIARGENLLRVSPHIYCNEQDIDLFLEVLYSAK